MHFATYLTEQAENDCQGNDDLIFRAECSPQIKLSEDRRTATRCK